MVTSTRRDHLNVRLFIEGVEVPCISATVSHTMQAPTSAYIQIVGTNAARHLKPKSLVEVYVLKEGGPTRRITDIEYIPRYEYNSSTNKIEKRMIPKNIALNGPIKLDGRLVSHEEAEEWLNYDLLFFGELIGFTGFTDSQSRTVNLLCADFTNNLDQINMFLVDGANLMAQSTLLRQQRFYGVNFSDSDIARLKDSEDLLASKTIDFTGDGVTSAPGEVKSEISNMVVSGVIGLEQKLDQILAKYGLQEGIQRVMRIITESYTYYKDINDELNLVDIVYVAPDEYTQKVFQFNQRVRYLQGILSRFSPVNSVRNLIKIIFRLTRFEFLSLPGSPFYLAKDPDDGSLIPTPKVSIIRPELFFSDPPACNVIFPDEVYTYNTNRQFMSEITRQIDFTDHILYAQQDGSIFNQSTVAPVAEIGKDGELKSLYPESMPLITSAMQDDIVAFSKILLPEEIFKGILTLTTQSSHELRVAATLGDNAPKGLLESENINFESDSPTTPEQELSATLFYMREVNYKFMRARYQTRIATASCKLLPRLSIGFPVFIPHRSMEEERTEGGTSIGMIGFCVSLTHVVSQAGGVTSVSASHVREIDEELSFFVNPNNTSEDGSIAIKPDFRDFVIPWAREKYGIDNLHNVYQEWLGGLTWKGSDSTKTIQEYLGTTTAVDAMLQFGPTQTINRLKQRFGNSIDTSIDTLRRSHFLPIYLAFFDGYLQLRRESHNWNLEEYMAPFMQRPVANMLQMRGYLHAYMTAEKAITDSNSGNEVAAIQTGLQALGIYNGEVDGVFESRTENAIKEFKKLAADKKLITSSRAASTDFGEEEFSALEHLLLTQIVQENDIPPKRGLASTSTGSFINRLIRRVERRRAVIRYKSSLEKIFALSEDKDSRGLSGI